MRSSPPTRAIPPSASASSGCGPFGEDSTYTNSAGQTVQGTRVGQGPNYGENTADKSVANSNYNALETTLRYQHHGSQFLLSYTYAKSIDQGSNLGEQLNPIDPRQSRTISAWDLKHDFVASYTLALPIATLFTKSNRLTEEWSLSGTTRFATGFPVTLFDNSDNSLLGTLGNGANNYLLDTPQYTAWAAQDQYQRTQWALQAFNTSLFPEETLGQLGNAKRRIFYGPGIDNFDLTLQKNLRLADANRSNSGRSLQRLQPCPVLRPGFGGWADRRSKLRCDRQRRRSSPHAARGKVHVLAGTASSRAW